MTPDTLSMHPLTRPHTHRSHTLYKPLPSHEPLPKARLASFYDTDIHSPPPAHKLSHEPIPRARLASFYAPYNRKLAALLKQYPSSRLPSGCTGTGRSGGRDGGEDGMDW